MLGWNMYSQYTVAVPLNILDANKFSLIDLIKCALSDIPLFYKTRLQKLIFASRKEGSRGKSQINIKDKDLMCMTK